MPGPMDTNYGTREQVEYARAMAKYLREKKGFQMTPGMAVLPGSWMHGLGDVVDAISQGRYQDIAGQQDRTLRQRALTGDTNYVAPSAPSTVGSSLSQYLHNLYKKTTGANKVITPGTEPKDLTTGSITPADKEGETVEPKTLNEYADAIKERENPDLFKGKVDRSKAQWDFKQHTNGFGTKARAEDETIDTAESHKRFDEDWAKAQKVVDEFKPGLPVGPKAALTSLTFNSGEAWKNAGLGKAIKDGNMDEAKKLFTQYNGVILKDEQGQPYKKVLKGLDDRRKQEVQWFDDQRPYSPTANKSPIGMTGAIGNLGGPKGDLDPRVAAGPQGDQVAQAPPYGMTPVTPTPRAPIQGVNDYMGAVPPRNPVSTPGQLEGQIMNAPAGETQSIIEQHKKDLQGRTVETPGGGKLNIPGDTNAPVTHIPGPDMNDFMGIPGLRARQGPDGKLRLLTLSGSEIPATIEGINKYRAELERQRTQIQKIGEAQTAPIEDAITKANNAPTQLQTLDTLDTTIKSSKDITFGPHAPAWNQIKSFLAGMSSDPSWVRGINEANTADKLNTLLAAGGVHDVSSRGSNLAFTTLMRANPGLLTTREGALQLVDLLKQEQKQHMEIGRLANRYRDKDPSSWMDRKQEYYDDHPIIVKQAIGKGQYRDIMAKQFTPEEADKAVEEGKLKKGMGFMRDDGKLGFVK